MDVVPGNVWRIELEPDLTRKQLQEVFNELSLFHPSVEDLEESLALSNVLYARIDYSRADDYAKFDAMTETELKAVSHVVGAMPLPRPWP